MAVAEGISPTEFWSLTPYLTKLALPALRDLHNGSAWMVAALSRTRKLPTMEEMLTRKPVVDVEDKLKGLFAAHNKAIKEKHG